MAVDVHGGTSCYFLDAFFLFLVLSSPTVVKKKLQTVPCSTPKRVRGGLDDNVEVCFKARCRVLVRCWRFAARGGAGNMIFYPKSSYALCFLSNPFQSSTAVPSFSSSCYKLVQSFYQKRFFFYVRSSRLFSQLHPETSHTPSVPFYAEEILEGVQVFLSLFRQFSRVFGVFLKVGLSEASNIYRTKKTKLAIPPVRPSA